VLYLLHLIKQLPLAIESVPGKSTTPDKKIADVGRPGSQHGHSQVINSKEEAAKPTLLKFGNTQQGRKNLKQATGTEAGVQRPSYQPGTPKKSISAPDVGSISNERTSQNIFETGEPMLATEGTIPSGESKGISHSQIAGLQKDSAKTAVTNKPTTLSGIEESTRANKPVKNRKDSSLHEHFYYSLLVGPDWSTVKFENTSKMGYSVGLMLGYQISRKLSVEAGALWDRKYYKSLGEYLDTTNLALPMHSMVLHLNGYCDMIEIPVNVKYNLINKQDRSWFVSAGVSSYIMKNENYNVTYKRYGPTYTKEYEYKNSTKNWFSILNISVGYKKSISKYTDLSIAPYIKLPITGVGIGKLPISSTGIYLSVSRFFH